MGRRRRRDPSDVDRERLSRYLRTGLAALGLVCLVLAIVLLVRVDRAGSGVIGGLLALEGAALLAVGRGLVEVRPLGPDSLLDTARPVEGGALGRRTLWTALAGVTAAGLAIRLVGIGGSFWLDEIVTVRDYSSHPFGQILTQYTPNNHLLNSLLTHLSFLAFGYAEWAIRIPALAAGVATVPVFFWVARPLMGDVRGLAAAALLAVAGPHVLFSQNARGYTLSLLFGLVATGALVRGLRDDRLRWWALFVIGAVLCVVAVPTGGFVVVGQLIVAAAAVAAVARRGGAYLPLGGRLAFVFGLVVVVTLQVYAPVLGQLPASAQDAWSEPGAGPRVLSLAFVHELVDSVSGGMGPVLLVAVLPCAAVGLVAFGKLARRDWPLVAALTLGPLVNVAYVAARGLSFSPRFLLFLTFVLLLVAVESVALVARWAEALIRGPRAVAVRRTVETGGLVLAGLVVAFPFARVAGLPNQPYREALERAASLRPGALVVGVYPADSGVRFYGVAHPRDSLDPARVATARNLAAFDALVSRAGPGGVVVLTTQPSVLREARPGLYRRLETGFAETEVLRARIGDGDIAIRLPRGA